MLWRIDLQPVTGALDQLKAERRCDIGGTVAHLRFGQVTVAIAVDAQYRHSDFGSRRAEQDADFASLRQRGDWQDEICRRFGNWLNARLTTPNTPMGAVEAAHWRDVLDEEMRLMRDEVADDE